MRIRKRPSSLAQQDEQNRRMNNGLNTKQGATAPAVKQKQEQDATRYEDATDSILKKKMKQEQGLMALASWAAVMSKREELEEHNKKQKKQECPIGCVSEQGRQAEEEINGEQPRTPPPLAGDKPAEHGKKACLCGKKWGLRQQQDLEPWLLRNKRARTWNKSKKNHEQDTADPMARQSHENCGLEQSDEDEQPTGTGDLRRALDWDQEESKRDMGPLLKAVHSVIGEAGMQGLTAREASEVIRRRRLLSDGDIPRTVKIAKAMRDSPYLVELGSRGDCNARFVMWSTYLQTTSGKGTRASVKTTLPPLLTSTTDGVVVGGTQVGRRGRRSQPQQRRRRGHGQYYSNQPDQHGQYQSQRQQLQTNSSSMVADDLLARVLMHVQKTLKTYQAPKVHQQQAQVVVENKQDKKPSHNDLLQEQRQFAQPQRQQQSVFLIDINSLPPPPSMEVNVAIERKQHNLAMEVSCKPYQQQQVAKPLLIDLNLAPDDSC